MADSDDLKKRIHELLGRWGAGDHSALDELVPLVYNDLRRIAGYLFKGEQRNHTLQPTIVVNEAFMKLRHSGGLECHDGAHFLAIYARSMRQILIDYARRRNTLKRYGETVSLDDVEIICRDRLSDLLVCKDAMERLARLSPRQASVVDLRVFCGLENGEIAEVLKISPNTVMRDWNFAWNWLRREMRREKPGLESA